MQNDAISNCVILHLFRIIVRITHFVIYCIVQEFSARNIKEQKNRGNSKIKDKDNKHDVNPNFHRFNSE